MEASPEWSCNDEDEGFMFEDDDYEDEAITYSATPVAKASTSQRGSPVRQLDVVQSTPSFSVLSQSQLQTTMEDAVALACDVLGVSPELSMFLLWRYKWRPDSLYQDWVESHVDVLKKNGFYEDAIAAVVDHPQEPPNTTAVQRAAMMCPITAEVVKFEDTSALCCGHRYSNVAWELYLQTALQESNVVGKRCPECPILVSNCFWKRFLSEDNYLRYCDQLTKAHVSSCPRVTWCPAPDCEYAIELLNPAKADVECRCGHPFCFVCADEPHFPVPCDVIRKWHEKNSNEADNVTWILVNAKICKGCKQPIEKNQGCMHMTCRCGYEFCWLCEVEWKKHSSSNSYRCNVYEETYDKDNTSDEKKKAKESLERYAHYYERYRAHNSAQRLATGEQMVQIRAHMDLLHGIVGELTDVDFLGEAVQQIIACRRMLKWSYAYGYFANWDTNSASKNLFEHHQGQLESTLETLHEMTEKFDPEGFIGEARESFGPLFEFKSSLVNITRVVKQFFRKMGEAFEADFM